MKKIKAIGIVLASLVLAGAARAETVDLAVRFLGEPIEASVSQEVETGALDLLFSEGFIVTTVSGILPAKDENLGILMKGARGGLADWLLLLDARLAAGAKATSAPASLHWRLYRLGDGIAVQEGELLSPLATDPGFADPVKRMRALGAAAAKAALATLRPSHALLWTGGGDAVLTGGS